MDAAATPRPGRIPPRAAAPRRHHPRRCWRRCAIGVDDWEGASFLVRGPTGKTEIVDNLFDLWRKAEALCRPALDPLADVHIGMKP